MSRLTEEEFEKVTNTFISRLSNEMSNAGCNDLFDDEFPQSVCEKFDSDFDLLEVWSNMISLNKKEDDKFN